MFRADSLAFALKESYILERFVLDTKLAAASSRDEVTSHAYAAGS